MIAKGSKVKLHYTLTVDGQVVDSSREIEPLEFESGSGHIIPGLDEALQGLKAGDKKVVVVPPEKAYGPMEDEAIQKVPKSAFEGGDDLQPGMVVTGEMEGETFHALVMEIVDDGIVLNLNHPLAGQTLEFDVEVMDVA